MNNGVLKAFQIHYKAYCSKYNPSQVQNKAAYSIMRCKSGELGRSISICEDCGHQEIHNNSCRNRSCPGCQAVLKEVWIDSRKSEVIGASYFHVVFTVPFELNSIIITNQKLLYSLMHRTVSKTLLELSADKKYLGATPGIIQVLHTWGQELNFHPHIHCIITGAGLTSSNQFQKGRDKFFIPVTVLSRKFRGIFLSELQSLYKNNILAFCGNTLPLRNSFEWSEFRNSLYHKEWIPHIKETFNGFGNAIEYLGRYTHRIAISNSRIVEVTDNYVSFTAKDYRTGESKLITIDGVEFIHRFLTHVLPSGFQKIRNCGFLNNRYKSKNLKLISKLTGRQLFKSIYNGLKMDELLKAVWDVNVHLCPACGCEHLNHAGRIFPMRN